MNAAEVSKETENILTEWIREYGNLVFSLCLKVLRNPETAHDTSQNVWEIIIRNFDGFKNRSKPGTWIYTIAYREALRVSRKEKKQRYGDLLRLYHNPDLHPLYHEEPQDSEQMAGWLAGTCNSCISWVVKTLEFRLRIIFVFRFVLDLSYQEIAKIMDMKETAVRQAARRSRRRLALFLEQECGIFKKSSVCKCGLEQYLKKGDFRKEILALRTMTEKAANLHKLGTPLPPAEYWEKMLTTVTK